MKEHGFNSDLESLAYTGATRFIHYNYKKAIARHNRAVIYIVSTTRFYLR